MAKRNVTEAIDLGNLNSGNEEPNGGTIENPNGPSGEGIDPASAASNASSEPAEGNGRDNGNAGGSGRKRRSDIGKRRGPRGTNQKAGLEIDGLTAVLLSSHALLAGITQARELELDEKEAKQLATALNGVAVYYDTVVSAKAMAWINLTQAVGLIYGTRLFAIRQRRQEERAKRRAASPAAPPPNTQRPASEANSGKPPQPQQEPPVLFRPAELNQVDLP